MVWALSPSRRGRVQIPSWSFRILSGTPRVRKLASRRAWYDRITLDARNQERRKRNQEESDKDSAFERRIHRPKAGTMIKLFKVKEKQRENAENANGRGPVKKQSAGELRLHKDITELNLPNSCAITFPNGKDDLMNFEVSIRPDEGYYAGGTFVFTFQVSPIYPHESPKVKCKTKVYHPNIDLEGNVCLNILREDWKPVLNINTVIYGLFHLFTVLILLVHMESGFLPQDTWCFSFLHFCCFFH
ncbi:hypothetical protein EUGRSUZ_H01237 [Eucalyptus grandis]|uniref:Uncharacterized protein n=2 Tax=Eucalyptus grandis TaxID=71139 RepID=A0ACC3JQ39_EUCGR|nr:hypothetical protein EUGRSUZ_H01237 [Eucalyptus grandis]